MSTPWWGELSRAHWWVLIVAVLGWLFDAMDQRPFILARTPALRDLLPASAAGQLPAFAGWATGLFIAGWATGGLLFGLLGDRWGRVRTMTLTIPVYSLFTGLSGLARSWPEFAAYRFLCGMGIGGEYAVGVALVAETMPARAGPFALGLVQAFSSVGAIIGSGLSLLVGPQTTLVTIRKRGVTPVFTLPGRAYAPPLRRPSVRSEAHNASTGLREADTGAGESTCQLA